jgi:hypothetical protein
MRIYVDECLIADLVIVSSKCLYVHACEPEDKLYITDVNRNRGISKYVYEHKYGKTDNACEQG